jgi:phage gp45-like
MSHSSSGGNGNGSGKEIPASTVNEAINGGGGEAVAGGATASPYHGVARAIDPVDHRTAWERNGDRSLSKEVENGSSW